MSQAPQHFRSSEKQASCVTFALPASLSARSFPFRRRPDMTIDWLTGRKTPNYLLAYSLPTLTNRAELSVHRKPRASSAGDKKRKTRKGRIVAGVESK